MLYLMNYLSHLVYFVLAIAVLGFAVSLINRLFYSLVGGSRALCYATGVIGTPIHELSHAVMCLLFGHRITEMRLFQIDEESGTLGYVNHSYNPRNFYQQLGNYFIGVAPLLGGSAVLFFAMRWLMPATAAEVSDYLVQFSSLQASGGFSGDTFLAMFRVMAETVRYLFLGLGSGFTAWIFFLLALCISLHMNLSGADIRGALPALPLVLILFAVFDFGFGFLSGALNLSLYQDAVRYLDMGGSFLLGMMMLSLILAAFSLLLVALLRGAGGLGKKILHR